MAESIQSPVNPKPGFAEGSMVLLREPAQDVPKHANMDPDRTCVTVLPGRSRPAFVRKPRNYRENPFGLTAIARALAPAPRRRRSYSAQYVVRVRSPSSPTYFNAYSPPPSLLHYHTSSQPTVTMQETVHTYPRYSPPVSEQRVVSNSVTTKVIPHNGRADESTLQHTCSSCGKYRSASHQSRHPLAPGEIPKLGTCRRCIREHTSSEDSAEDERRLRRTYSYAKGHKGSRYRWRRKFRDTDSMITYPRRSPCKEELRVIHETRSITHDHHRARSSSREKTHIRVTIEPEQTRRSGRRRSIEPANLLEDTQYVKQGKRSRSRSRDARLFDDGWPMSVRVRRDDHGRTIRRMVPELYRPREVRTIEHGCDGNLAREVSSIYPVIHRSSASSLSKLTAPYRVEERETIASHERSYSPPFPVRRRSIEETYTSRSFNKRFRRRPTNSVRILRMSRETDHETQTHGGELPALQRRLSFVEKGSPLRSSTRRQPAEAEEPVGSHWRQEIRDTQLESSDEASLHEFPNHVRSYSTFFTQRDTHSPTGNSNEEYELVRDLERTRIAPRRTYFPQPTAITRRIDHHHTLHHERSMGGSADEELRRYYDVSDGAAF